MRKSKHGVAAVVLVLSISLEAEAKDLCAAYRSTAPLPSWYSQLCNAADGSQKAAIGGAFSTLGDAVNLNPSAIPVSPIPYGFEYISSQGNSLAQNNFGLIKGFRNFGAAITSNSQNTFYGESVFTQPGTVVSSVISGISPSEVVPTINMGSALSLTGLLPKKTVFLPSIGLLYKLNTSTGGMTPAVGFSLAWRGLTGGLSFSHDPETNTTPQVDYTTFTLGLKTSFFQFEWVNISSKVPTTNYSYSGNQVNQTNLQSQHSANIFTLSATLKHFLLTAALRDYQDVNLYWHTQYHLAIQYQYSNLLAVGFLHNYVVGTESLGLQLLL